MAAALSDILKFKEPIIENCTHRNRSAPVHQAVASILCPEVIESSHNLKQKMVDWGSPIVANSAAIRDK